MKTKLLSVMLLTTCFFCSGASVEKSEKVVKSRLNEATVFFSGAELTHSAATMLVRGNNELIIEGLSPNIDKNSIKVRANNGVIVSAFEFSIDDRQVNTPNDVRIKAMKDSVELLTEQVDMIKSEIKVDGELSQLMKKGIDKNIADTLTINDLMKAMQYYQTKSTEIETRLISNRYKEKKLAAKLTELSLRVNAQSATKYEKSASLRVSCTSPLAGSTTFIVSYFTSLASWIPFYDINVVSTSRPIKILAKARVKQTTAMDWNNVKLTLSTVIPGNAKDAPLFSTWYLQYMAKPINYPVFSQNAVSYKSKDASGTEINRNAEEVFIPKTIDDYIVARENELNLTFNIDLPYNIPGNGKEQSIELQTKEIAANYSYYCAPKLDRETFLLAEIPDWEHLNLLTGKANIIYDGTYVGETFINASSTQENLHLTLGVDKRVVVKRELVKDLSSTKTSGNDVKQVFTYKLTVKNTHTRSVKMILKDQYPKSAIKEIETEFLEKETTKPTFHKEDVGVLTWEETLKHGETKTYQISYSVKYPKGKEIAL